MADSGAVVIIIIIMFRPVTIRMPLPVWAAGERHVTLEQKPASLIQWLPVWAAGNRTVTSQASWASVPLRTAWYVGGGVLLVTPRNGRIAGHVVVEGLPQPDRRVLLFYRATLQLVASTRTDDEGAFEFGELYPDGRYWVVTLDELAGAPAFNALVSDYVLPVIP